VNAHYLEKHIRDLQVKGRTMLIHAIYQLKDAVVPNLWPYATRLANEVLNITPRTKDGSMPMIFFAKTDCPPRLDHLHPFGCPAHVTTCN